MEIRLRKLLSHTEILLGLLSNIYLQKTFFLINTNKMAKFALNATLINLLVNVKTRTVESYMWAFLYLPRIIQTDANLNDARENLICCCVMTLKLK